MRTQPRVTISLPLSKMIGHRFGRLTVAAEAERRGYQRFYFVRCDCGIEKQVSSNCLRTGVTKSCGCLRDQVKHGGYAKGERAPEIGSWQGMKDRCYKPSHKSFKNYGGRGISVCRRWLDSYETFLADMGRKPTPQHTIDRIDNDGDYEPDNCKWSTPSEQRRNQRPVESRVSA